MRRFRHANENGQHGSLTKAGPSFHLLDVLKQPVLVRFLGGLRGVWVLPGSAERPLPESDACASSSAMVA